MLTALRQRFGENVRRARLARGLTQERLAEGCGLSVDAIRRIERGRISPSLDTLAKLSIGLHVSLSTLFDTFERKRRNEIEELCDLLTSRSQKDVQLVLALARVVLTYR